MERNRRALLGLFLVIIGAFILLDNLHILPRMPWWIFTWQMLLIAIGVFNLLLGNRTPAVVLIGIGAFFLLEEIYYFNWRDFWPVILIIIGLAFIFRQRSMARGNVLQDNYFDALNILGGGNQKVASHKLEGGKITTIFGGSEIDLREAKPVDGATIEIFTMFGGAEITVPEDWNVKVEVTSILGAFEDKRSNVKTDDKSPTIRIKGMTLLGGGELKS